MEDLEDILLMDMAPVLRVQDGIKCPSVQEKPYCLMIGAYVIPREQDNVDALYPCPRFIMISGKDMDDLEKKATSYIKSEIEFAKGDFEK